MKALSDIVMLDLTHMLSGPFAAMLLADLGRPDRQGGAAGQPAR